MKPLATNSLATSPLVRPAVFVALALALALPAVACRDLSDQGRARADAGGAGGDGGARDGISIQDVQGDGVAVGDEVTLREVVIVAVDTYGGRRGSVYVMEPEGGPHSGILVFLNGTQAAGLAPGDLIDVEGGEKTEFAFDADDSGRSLTQIVAAGGGDIELTKVGTGDIPEPEVVDPAALAADDDEAEKWAGVLITVAEVGVESPPEEITSDETFQEMRVSGPMLVVSDLVGFPDEVAIGDCYASITGILTYAFDYQLLPRSEDDFAPDGDSCPPPPDAMTVRQVKRGDDIQEGDPVNIEGAIVTFAPDDDNRFLYIQDSVETPDEYNGILVFGGGDAGAQPEGVQAGSIVDVSGELGSFQGATQITGTVQVTLRDDEPVEPVFFAEVAIDVLADLTAGAPYEHVLVRLENVEVVDDADGISVGDGGEESLLVDDFQMTGQLPNFTVGDCIASLTGVMARTDLSDQDPDRRLYPRDESDIVEDGDCSTAAN